MAGPAGIKEVAVRAGVSVGTVSNVINRPHLVRTETRERVEAAMADLAFVRNESARQLRAGRSRLMAYVFLDAENPFFIDVARGAEDACRDLGFALIMCNSGEDLAREEDYLSLLLEQRVHGVLVSTIDDHGARLRSLPQLGVPVVLVDRGEADTTAWCTVGSNDVLGGRLAVGHLLERGHRRIAFMGGALQVPQMRRRWEGARAAVADAEAEEEAEAEAGQVAELILMETTTTTVAEGRRAGRLVAGMAPADRPTAVFCGNDLVALGLLQELIHSRLRVPDDVAIVGYDDISFAAAAAVPLTSIRQPSRAIGRTAVEMLVHEAGGEDAGPHRHRRVEFDPELVVRESSGAHLASPPAP